MATNKRNYPNDYYAWYNDDSRIAIVEQRTDLESNTHNDEYDSFQGDGDLSGTITNMTIDGTTVTVTCSEAHGLTHTTSDRIIISGTRHYDGNYTLVSTPSTTTFTITSSAILSDADSVNALAVSSGIGTATTTSNHGYLVGDKVYINADNNTYDEEVTIEELCRKILKQMGRQLDIKYSEAPKGETNRRCPDISKLKALGYSPQINLDTGLNLVVE